MKKRIISLLLAVCMVLSLVPTMVFAEGGVEYRYCDENGKNWQTGTKTEYTVVSSEDYTWGDDGNGGWYVATGNVTIGSRVTVSGEVHLILTDGCYLLVNGGIRVEDDDNDPDTTSPNALTIYAQSDPVLNADGTVNETNNKAGKLTTQNVATYNAGIGGSSADGIEIKDCGTITINGGIVTATATYGAGIGGSDGGSGGTITINGGKVKANSTCGAGIGGGAGGNFAGNGGIVTINGGTVTASSNYGAGIGSGAGFGAGLQAGSGGDVTITGGVVTATSTNMEGIGGTFSPCIFRTNNGNAVLFATSIDDQSNKSSWSGIIFEGDNDGIIYGTSVTPTDDFTIPTGKTLTIGENQTLTIPEGKTLTNEGTITNNGKIFVDGTFTGTLTGTGSVYCALTVSGCTASFMNPYNYNNKTYATAGSEIALTPDTPTGYEFKQWNSVPAVTISENKFTMPSAAVKINALFDLLTYNVAFVLNGGTINSGNITGYTYGQGATLPTDVTKAGYTFKGWYDNEELTGSPVTAISDTDTLDKEFWAKWEVNTYTVTFDTDGGNTIPDKNVLWTDKVLDGITAPTKDGWKFTGWKYGDVTVNDNIEYCYLVADETITSITLVAQWKANNYTVKFNTDGGNIINDKTSVKWDDKVLDGITAPTKDGWKFTGWKFGDVTVTADTTYSYLAGIDTVMEIELTAQWNDITAPTGEISIDTNSWTKFLNNITFGLFFKDTQEVTITASDNSGEDVTIEYLLSDKELTADELENATFTAYNDIFGINPDNEYVIYARLTDKSGNYSYINSDGIVLDSVVPVISGVENGKTYCEAQTVTVTEEYVESVKVNGTEVTLDANNQFTLNEGTHTIVVTDKAGNVSAEMIVTVNDGHTDENPKDHKCDICGETLSEHAYEWQSGNGQYWQKCGYCGNETEKKDIPEIIINAPDTVCRTQNCEISATLPTDITDAVLSVEFAYFGGAVYLTVENGMLSYIVEASYYSDDENSFNIVIYATTADGFPLEVSKTVQIQDKHAGGKADCSNKPVCDTCGEEYGEVDSTNHNLEHIPAKAATVTENGNTEYWHCKDCGKYFANENGEKEIELSDTIIAKLPPEIIKGAGQSVTEGEKKVLSFTSNAAYSDFVRVEIDGETLDAENYTATEGSTIISLTADYVATLSAGKHTIGIVSESGTATTTFTVNAKTVDNPDTGDNSHMVLWIALALVSGSAMIGTTIAGTKKKRSAR